MSRGTHYLALSIRFCIHYRVSPSNARHFACREWSAPKNSAASRKKEEKGRIWGLSVQKTVPYGERALRLVCLSSFYVYAGSTIYSPSRLLRVNHATLLASLPIRLFKVLMDCKGADSVLAILHLAVKLLRAGGFTTSVALYTRKHKL